MMIRLVSMSYIALVAGLVFGLYHVKFETQALEKQKAVLVKDIAHANADINVLQAEWANRTAPDNLKRLTQAYLPAMRPTEPMQMVALSKIPMRMTPSSDDQIDQLLSMVELRPNAQASARHPAL
jgi:hypothetical protein